MGKFRDVHNQVTSPTGSALLLCFAIGVARWSNGGGTCESRDIEWQVKCMISAERYTCPFGGIEQGVFEAEATWVIQVQLP